MLREGGRVCVLQLPGCRIVATTGDHVIPRSVDPSREYDVTNGRPACLPCNQRRSASLDTPRPRVDARRFFDQP